MIQRLVRWMGSRLSVQTGLHSYSAELVTEMKELLASLSMHKVDPATRLKELTFIVFDTETTGFHPYAGDELLSIGACKVVDGKVLKADTFFEWINPMRSIPPHIQELLAVTEEDVNHASLPMEVIYRFLQYAQSGCLVAHNAEFDLHFINKQLKATCNQLLKQPYIDTMVLAYHLFPTLRSHSLDQLLHVFQVPLGQRHHAREDAVMTAEMFVQMIEVLEERGVYSLLGLQHYIRRQSAYGLL